MRLTLDYCPGIVSGMSVLQPDMTVPAIGPNAKAFWNKPTGTNPNANYPKFLEPSGTKFARVSWEEVVGRGIENRLLESLSHALPDGAIVAGGFMTSFMANDKKAKDIDIFFTGPEAFAQTFNRLLDPEGKRVRADYVGDFCFDKDEHWGILGYKLDEGSRKSLVNPGDGWTVTDDTRYVKFVHNHLPPIQLIKLAWYDSAEHVIDSFDLTVAQFALDVKTSELVMNPLSVFDLTGKKIVLHRMQFPSSTMRRIIKYTNKGYYACPGALAKIDQEVADHIDDDDAQYVYID